MRITSIHAVNSALNMKGVVYEWQVFSDWGCRIVGSYEQPSDNIIIDEIGIRQIRTPSHKNLPFKTTPFMFNAEFTA